MYALRTTHYTETPRTTGNSHIPNWRLQRHPSHFSASNKMIDDIMPHITHYAPHYRAKTSACLVAKRMSFWIQFGKLGYKQDVTAHHTSNFFARSTNIGKRRPVDGMSFAQRNTGYSF
jgi:hypothetical protein